MFEHHGSERSERQNVVLAGYLATIAGFVDAVGVVELDRFTSHVTGTVVRTTAALSQHAGHPLEGLAMLAMFLAGAVLSSSLLESAAFSRGSVAYGVALALEAALLLGVAFSAATLHSWQVAALCCAMGMQNALVTRLSGALVRTTHLTGVVTDLGIEIARWLRYWRVKRARAVEPPFASRIQLLGSIASAFIVGATAGAFAATAGGLIVLVLPALLLAAGSFVALSRKR